MNKSDFEINKAVADNYLPCYYRYNENDKIVELIGIDLSCEFGSCIDIEKERVYGKFDPCNNPADAMPIIIEHGISLIFQEGIFQFATYDGNFEVHGDNPYRAAMEVFLEMNK